MARWGWGGGWGVLNELISSGSSHLVHIRPQGGHVVDARRRHCNRAVHLSRVIRAPEAGVD